MISVDTKKKELVGTFKNAGIEWQPQDAPELVDVHDFPSDALGKAIPYGVYDVADNSGFVNVGTDHDTPVFAVTSIHAWWKRMGSKRYPDATELFITVDVGGSSSYRVRVWKFELQRLADKLRLPIHVSHFPPGTSKWNKIEHRLFSFITMNWRGKPLRTYETVVSLIGNTTNSGSLIVVATRSGRKSRQSKCANSRSSRTLSTATGIIRFTRDRSRRDESGYLFEGPKRSIAVVRRDFSGCVEADALLRVSRGPPWRRRLTADG